MENEVTEFFRKEVERMESQGYTIEEIKRQIDAMIRIQNMVTMAVA